MRPYVKVVAVHGLIVQRDGHPDANVCLPLYRGGGDDEVVGVVSHQVHLKHAVQALGQEWRRNQSAGVQEAKGLSAAGGTELLWYGR